MSDYVNIPLWLITDPNLTGSELRVLSYLLSFDLPDKRAGGSRKGYVFVSRTRIGNDLHISTRRVSRVIVSLEHKGYLKRNNSNGRVTRLRFTLEQYDRGSKRPRVKKTEGQEVQETQGQKVHGTPEHFGPPEEKKVKNRKLREEGDSSPAPSRNRKSKDEQLEEIKAKFPKYQEKFPYRNIPQHYDKWLNWLKTYDKRPKNYAASFNNFCYPGHWEKDLKEEIASGMYNKAQTKPTTEPQTNEAAEAEFQQYWSEICGLPDDEQKRLEKEAKALCTKFPIKPAIEAMMVELYTKGRTHDDTTE